MLGETERPALLPTHHGVRRILMAALRGHSLQELLDDGWTEGELHRVVDSRPSPDSLHEPLAP